MGVGIHSLKLEYKKRRSEIKKRLGDFKKNWRDLSEKELFGELCFCICTPQSKAVYCDMAIKSLMTNNDLFNGDIRGIKRGLRKVRFPNNKARYILNARKCLTGSGRLEIRSKIDTGNIKAARDWLADSIKGIGFKEASHFLRNIGLGGNLAILDVHILKNMKRYRLIKDIPVSISGKKYLFLEEKLEKFSKKMGIPMAELDLLFWAKETGKVFK